MGFYGRQLGKSRFAMTPNGEIVCIRMDDCAKIQLAVNYFLLKVFV